MSRGIEGRQAAWEAWQRIYTLNTAYTPEAIRPEAYIHQCGAAGLLDDDQDLASVICPGCNVEIARPEDQCTPLYRGPAAEST